MITDELLVVGNKKPKEKKGKYRKIFHRKRGQYSSLKNSVFQLMEPIRLEADCVVTKTGYMDYLMFENYPIIDESKEVQQLVLNAFTDFFRRVTVDIKLIFMGYSADTNGQIQHIQKRASLSNTPLHSFIDLQRKHKIWELQQAHHRLQEDIVYVQVFGKTKEELQRGKSELLSTNSSYLTIHEISPVLKKQIMYQLYNLGQPVPVFSETCSLANHKVDKVFMSEIMPESGLRFKNDKYIQNGRGYIGIYHLHRYAKKERLLWGEVVFRHPNLITTVDIHHLEDRKVRSKLTKAISEENGNKHRGANVEIRMQSAIEEELLSNLLEDMVSSNESVKEVKIRYFLFGQTKEEIHAQAQAIDDRLFSRGYKADFFIGEEDLEYQSLFLSLTEQKKQKRRAGKHLTASDLGASYPLNHSQLLDPTGFYFGTTNTGGLFVFDIFHKDTQRLSYNFVLLGKPGSGKSSALKKLGSHNHLANNYTIYFMANNENEKFMKQYGGLSIDASGKDGTANPFQIFATILNEDGSIDEESSWKITLNKLVVIYQNLYGSIDVELANAVDRYADLFLNQWFEEKGLSKICCTQYEATDYPKAEDFLHFIQKMLYQSNELSDLERQRLDRLEQTTLKMVHAHGLMFNQFTSVDFSQYLSVSFDLSRLLNQDDRIFNAQLYNLLFMVWNQAMMRGMREKYLVEIGRREINEAIRTLIIFDEFHNITRKGNESAIDLLDRYEREARKAFGGLGIATHDISDLFSEHSSDNFKEKVRKLLKLSTYVFIMQQDASSKVELQKCFQDTLKESELQRAATLKVGEAILSIRGKGNYQIKIDLSKTERDIFTGGY